MNKLLARASLAVFLLVGLLLITLFLSNGKIAFALLTLGVVIITTIIFTNPKAYPFRFMYPGLVTFLFFMILPMLFTIYIGFTNLSTGHLLSKDRVYGLLQEETYIPETGAEDHTFKLKNLEDDKFQIYVTSLNRKKHYTTTFSVEQDPKEIFLAPIASNEITDFSPLKKGEVYRLREKLDDFAFVLPDKTRLYYLRSHLLVNLKKRFIPTGDYQLKDQKTGITYDANEDTGFFTAGEESLAPGFYVNVGLRNFTKLYSNSSIRASFFKIFTWTLMWATGTVILTFTLGMFLALIVNNKDLKLKPIYRSLLIIPYSIPFFISILIFKGMLNKDFGIINELLMTVGLPKVSWLGDPLMAKISCLLVNLWLGFPYMFLITTGILQSIPGSVYEAASLDGAGRWATFKSITLPLIFSAVGPLLVGSFAFNLNNFVGIYLLTGGGPPIMGAVTPAGETDILISYTYRLAFEGGQGQDFGMASSIAMLIFIIITIITLINFKISGMMKETQAR